MPAKKSSSTKSTASTASAPASPAKKSRASSPNASATKSTASAKSSGKGSGKGKTTSPKTSGKGKTAAAPATPTPAPAQVAAPVTPPSTAASTAASTASTDSAVALEQSWDGIQTQFTSLTTRLAEFKTTYTSLVADLKTLQKDVQRYMREASRKQKRKRKTATPADGVKRTPSGFAKPALISDELCSFLGKPSGTEMARTEVTKHITSYIKENNLQNAANKREIAPDAALKTLLNIGKGDTLTFFNLQKYMKVHFPKAATASV